MGTQDHEVGKPPPKRRCEQLLEKSDVEKSELSPEIEALINRATYPSNKGKSKVLRSLKQDLLK